MGDVRPFQVFCFLRVRSSVMRGLLSCPPFLPGCALFFSLSAGAALISEIYFIFLHAEVCAIMAFEKETHANAVRASEGSGWGLCGFADAKHFYYGGNSQYEKEEKPDFDTCHGSSDGGGACSLQFGR